ncbi:MAG: hypothetical protein R3B90_12420 [Planctomycetaceae bacterium]
MISTLTEVPRTTTLAAGGVVALTNGNYASSYRNWDNGAVVDAGRSPGGAARRGSAERSAPPTASSAPVTSDQVGNGGVVALTNGNYVVVSRNWDNGAVVTGRVTWGSGTAGGQRSGRRDQQPRRHPE